MDRKAKAFALACLLAPSLSIGDAMDALESYVGYTIAVVTHIAGYVDPNGKRSDDFEGCEYDRRIIFDDGTALVCSTYRYHYAYHPKAALLVKGSTLNGRQYTSVVMIVGDDAYPMRSFLAK
jgi:hypothetical protein